MRVTHVGRIAILLTSIALLPSFGLATASPWMPPDTAGDVSRIRSGVSARQTLLRTAVVISQVSETRKFEEIEDQRHADRVARVHEQHEIQLREARALAADAARLEQISQQKAYQLEEAESLRLLEKLDSSVRLRRTVTLDLPNGLARHDDEDLRDVAALAREHNLSHDRRLTLDKTGSVIQRRDGNEVRILPPAAGRFAMVMPGQTFKLETELMHLGVLPSRFVDGSFNLTARSLPDQGLVELTGRSRSDGPPDFVATLAPTEDYALRAMVVYHDGRAAWEIHNADFRFEGGLFIPYETRRLVHYQIAGFLTEQRRVMRAEINLLLPNGEATFQVPEDVRLIDATGTQSH